jgi:hypothetical protein
VVLIAVVTTVMAAPLLRICIDRADAGATELVPSETPEADVLVVA